jgi:hypothetical protein
MANIFKQNTRFEALNESNNNGNNGNNGNNRRDNSFSERRVRSEGRDEGRSSESRRQNNSAQSFKTQADVAAKEQAAKLELSEDNFPTLAAVAPSTAAQANYGSFSQCVKTVIKTETPELPAVDPDLLNLEPGWLLLKHDRKTHTTVWKSNEIYDLAPIEKTPDELAWDALDELIALHEKRTNDFIDTWGYEEWERTFRSPNYDYEYFDKLNELYEEELEKDRIKQQEASDLAADADDYDYREW